MFFTLQVKSLYRFLNLVDGSWRNAVYVECTSCPFGQASCTGWLLAVDHDGTPILYDTELFRRQTGQRADKTECIAVISQQAFEQMYKRWLLWNLSDPHRCPIRDLAGN